MNTNTISNAVNAYSSTTPAYNKKTNEKTAEKDTAKHDDKGVVYEKMSKADREAIITQLKSDAQQRTQQMRSMVEDMMKKQGQQIGNSDSMWKFLAGGNFTVSAEAKAQAKAAIAEDGYWGVTQTSDRIVEFAKALTGGDPAKAEDMRKAFEKGFKAATKSWGKELPSISQDTYKAVMDKFDQWAGTKKAGDTEGAAQ